MTRDEWTRRYAARVWELGVNEPLATQVAEIGAQVQAENGDPWEDPEHYANDEMSYWDDDGE